MCSQKKCPSFFGFHRKLAHTKLHHNKDKSIKRNVHYLCAYQQLVSTSPFILYHISILIYSYLLQLPFFASTSATTGVRPPPSPPQADIRNSNTVLPLTSDEVIVSANPLHLTLSFQRHICPCACCCLQQIHPFSLTLVVFHLHRR